MRLKKKQKHVCGIYHIKTMEAYCVSCKKIYCKQNSSFRKAKKKNRLILVSSCAISGKKKSIFIKNKEPPNFINI